MKKTTNLRKSTTLLASLILCSSFQFCKQFEEGAPPEPEPTVYVPPVAAQPQPVNPVLTCDTTTQVCPPTGGWPADILAECKKGRTDAECTGPLEKTLYDAFVKSSESAKEVESTCKTKYVNGSSANVANFRSSPAISNNIIRVPPNGTVVQATGYDGPWVKTTLSGQAGYLHKTVLSCDFIAIAGGGSGGGVSQPPAPPASNGNCSGNFPNRCSVKTKPALARQTNCWAVKQVGGYTIAGKKVDTVDDDRLGVFGGERDCFSNLKDIRVQWGAGVLHRNAAARYSKSWGCYVEVDQLTCDCGNLKCN